MITGLLLAAGHARRFGADKLAATLADGVPVALRSAAQMAAAVDQLLVVVQTSTSVSARLLEAAGYTLVVCAQAVNGMAYSLAGGVRASATSTAWVIGLADMPLLQTATIQQLIKHYRDSDRIIVPQHAGRDGHPVIFPARYGEALQALEGDRGARALLQTHAGDINHVEVDDRGILIDIDTPEDLAKLAAE